MKIGDLFSDIIEDNLIGILLVDCKNNKVILTSIEPEDFYKRTHYYIFKTIKELDANRKPVDIVSVYELLKFNNELELAGGQGLINSLALDANINININNQIKTLLKYSKKRKLINLCDSIKKNLNNNMDVDELGNNLLISIQDILNVYNGHKSNLIATGIVEAMENLERISENNEGLLGLPTSFKELDKLTSGLCPGRLYILAARPSVGKSAIAQQIAEYVASNNNVLYFSLEMGLEEYTQRSIYRRSGYNQEHLSRGIIPKDQIFEAFYQATDDLSKLKLHIVDDAKCTLQTIERNLQELKAKKQECKFVVIDYLQLMKSDTNKFTERDYDIVTNNSKGLKQLARKYKIPILALAQLSRACEQRQDKRPLLSDLRDSGSLEQDADVVMFLYREGIYNPRYTGTGELIIAKNRQGKRGKVINLYFNEGKTEFKEQQKEGM